MSFTEIGRGTYLEGLCVHGDAVWVSDPLAGGIHDFSGGRRGRALLADRQWIGGLAFDAEGQVLVSGLDIVRLDLATGDAVTVIDGVPGANEMAFDDRGGFYFGSTDLASIIAGKPPGPSALHYVAADGSVRVVKEGLRFSNGMAVSADGGTLYHNETWVGTSAYPILADGSLGDGRMLIEKSDCDGMAIDQEGVVWITGYGSEFLTRLAPDGTPLDPLPLPGFSATQLRFGGPDGHDLYVTGVTLAAAEVIAAGRMPEGESSALLKGRAAVAGLQRIAPSLAAREMQNV